MGILEHVGQKSGKPYRTPLNVFATDDGFAIVLTYGPDRDWLKNITAAGRTRMRHRVHVRAHLHRAAGVVHEAVKQAPFEMAIDAAVDESAASVEPIDKAVIDAADLLVCVIEDANDDVMQIGIWCIGLGCTKTQA